MRCSPDRIITHRVLEFPTPLGDHASGKVERDAEGARRRRIDAPRAFRRTPWWLDLSPEPRDHPLVGGYDTRLGGPAVDRPNQLPIALHSPVAERREPVGQLTSVRSVIVATGRG